MQKTCSQCSAPFEITDTDLAFYDAVSPVIAGRKFPIPAPTFCPDCRYQRRLMWRNERNLYHRKCSATGKDVVSIFSPDKSWPPVFEQSYWWSDKWDARDYGREFDFNRPFFEQWAALFRDTPQTAMNNQMSENCEYTNQSQKNKDCYLIFCSDQSRDCYYGMWNGTSNNCVDCVYIENCELCYELLNGKNCYRCFFSQNLENCSDVSFSSNCIGCRNCVGCINLRNKEHCILNEQYEPEEYAKRLADLHLSSTAGIQDMQKKTAALFADAPRKYFLGDHCEDFSGNYAMHLRDAHNVYNCRDCEHVKHFQDVWRANNCQDLTETIENNFCYSLEGCANSVNTLFSKKFYNLHNSIYCSHCNGSKNLFGCVSLNQNAYCILNKQYSKEEYEELVPKIIEHMQKMGEWGQHFPPEYSPYGYNETVAKEYFPLSEEEVKKRGWKWHDAAEETHSVSRTVNTKDLPQTIAEVPDDILNWAITCETTGKPFRIIKQELDFYRKLNLPLPHINHNERYERRMALRNPRKLWARECMKCGKGLQSTYSPDRPETVYCEECYLSAVY